MSFMKRFGSLLAVSSLLFTLTSCGSGGGGGSSAPPPAAPAAPATVTGQAVKGPFKKGSTVTAIQFGGPGSATTSITDDTGRYALSIPWNGPTEGTVTGFYVDEFDGQTSTTPISLSAVTNIRISTAGQIHFNLPTTMVAKLTEADLPGNQPPPQSLVLDKNAIVGQTISAFLGATSTLNDLASVDLSQPGAGPAQLLAFQLIVLAAMPPSSNVNQVISQFTQNLRNNKTFTDEVPGITGVTAADLETARTELKTGTALTVKRLGKQVPISQIIANLAGSAGVKSTGNDLALQINNSQVTSITISPAATLIAVNQTKSLTASVMSANGSLKDKALLWFSSDPTIAAVDVNGKVTGRALGSVTVHASNGSVISNSISVTVVSGALTSIEVAQSAPALQVGEQVQFVAKALDAAGNELKDVEITWQSSDPTVASIDDTGLATALKLGTTSIVASNGAISSPGVSLAVVPPPPDPPTIDFVNPPGGLPGAIITIVGSNFGPTAAENTVKFGTLTATIKSATAEKLVVIVPAGAISGPITVTGPGGSGNSPFSFATTVTDPGKGPSSSSVNVGSGPQGITVTPDETRVYVVNAKATPASMTVINGVTNSSVGTINLPSVSSTFGTPAVSFDGHWVYVSLSNAVGVIDATLVIPPVVSLPCCTAPAQVRLSFDGKRLYVADAVGKLIIISTATNTVVKTYDLPGGQGVFGVAEHPEGKRVYVSNQTTNTIFAVDTDQNVVTPIPITIQGGQSAPRGIAIRPDGQAAYVSLFGANSVAVVDTNTNTVSAIVPLLPHGLGTDSSKNPNGIAVSPDGKLAYVALTCGTVSAFCPSSLDAGAISVLDLSMFPPTVTDFTITGSNATQDVTFTASGSHAFVTGERPGNTDRAFRLP